MSPGSGIDLAYSKQELEHHGVPVLIKGATVTADGNSGTDPIYVGHFKEGNFFLDVTAFAPTNIIFTIQTRGPEGKWYTIVTFTTVTGVTNEMKVLAANLGEYIRLAWDHTGAGAVTFTCYGYFKK